MALKPSRTVVVKGRTIYVFSTANGGMLFKRREQTKVTAHNAAREGMIPAKVIYRVKEKA